MASVTRGFRNQVGRHGRLTSDFMALIGEAADPGDTDWNRVAAFAERHDVATLLVTQLRGTPAWDLLPRPARDAAQQQHRRVAAHNLHLLRDLERTCHLLTANGIEVLVFKGAAWLASGRIHDPGQRRMADLDLLVRPSDLAAAEALLVGVGLQVTHRLPGHEVSLAAHATSIDLHEAPGAQDLATVLPFHEAWERAVPLAWDGPSVRTLSPTDDALHQVLHTGLHDAGRGDLSSLVRQLLTFTTIAPPGDDVDWQTIDRTLDRHADAGWMSRRFLAVAEAMTGRPSPLALSPADHRRARTWTVPLAWGISPAAAWHANAAFSRESIDAQYGGSRGFALAWGRLKHAAHLVERYGRRPSLAFARGTEAEPAPDDKG